MSGQIVTFYSYKGGVGRTSALANVAAVLSSWGYRILCIDWDLDAPGLHYYLQRPGDGPIRGGLVDAIHEFSTTGHLDFDKHVVKAAPHGHAPTFDFLPAGSTERDYFDVTQAIDWSDLYSTKDLGSHLESYRDIWMRRYDLVLIDSRTGITDIGGICTAQLPDILVMLFTASNQSLRGTLDVAQRALRARDSLPYDRSRLLIVPVPSRFDAKEEYRRAEEWRERFADSLVDLVSPWLHREVSVKDFLDQITIPYVPFWSFGEEVATANDKKGQPGDLAYTLVTLSATLAHGLDRTELLGESRELYVAAAARGVGTSSSDRYRYDVLLSYDVQDRGVGVRCADLLRSSRLEVLDWLHDGDERSPRSAVARCRHCVVILPRAGSSRRLQREVEVFIRQSLDDDSDRQIFPIALDEDSGGVTLGPLRHYERVPAWPPYSVSYAVNFVAGQIEYSEANGLFQLFQRELGRSHISSIHAESRLADSMARLAKLKWSVGEYGDAVRYLDGSLEHYRGAKDRVAETSTLVQFGDLLVDIGQISQATGYYFRALESGIDSADRAGEARTRGKIARSAMLLEDIESATAMQREAQRIWLDLLSAEPANYEWQHGLETSLTDAGEIARTQGDGAAARTAFEAALEIAARLAAADPQDVGRQGDLAFSHDRLGDVAVAAGDLAVAETAFQAALEIRSQLAAEDPQDSGWQRDLAVSHDKLGDVAVAAGHLAVARSAFQAALEIRVRLTDADPRNTGWQRDLAVSYDKLGDVAVAADDLAVAATAYRRAFEIRARLAAADPVNAQWQRDLSRCYDKLGDVAVAAGDLAAARTAFQAALDIRVRRAAVDPQNPGWQRDLAVSYDKLGDVAIAADDLAAARTAFQAALEIRTRLAAAHPGNTSLAQLVQSSRDKLDRTSSSN